MIPKQIFFFWFGEDIPDYVHKTKYIFGQMNPKFKIDFIYYNKNDIFNCNDSILNYCKDLIFKTKCGIINKYFNFINKRLESKFNFLQILSDIIRFEYLYYYGGIYLDCDTYPIKEFDDNLLSRNGFSQSVLCYRNKKYNIDDKLSSDKTEYCDTNFSKNLNNYHCYYYTDIYFIGLKKEYTENDIIFKNNAKFQNPLNPPWIRNFENTKIFKDLKERYYNLDDKIYDSLFYWSHYIMHFNNTNWQNNYKNSKMFCQYDVDLYES